MMNNENGRSMVEMLGVLAIIGVLSVAGIAGYTMAMNKYKSNEILNLASQAVILAQTYNGGEGIDSEKSYTQLGLTVTAPVTSLSVAPGSNGKYDVTVITSADKACEMAQENAGTLYTITCS